MSKRGQITVFIIIGIVLLVLISIIVYMTGERAAAPIEAEGMRAITVAEEMRPLQDFVQTCLAVMGREGLERLGARAGHIAPRQRFNPAQPTEGAAIQFAPDSSVMVPQWWHLGTKNTCAGDCAYASEQPALTREQGGPQSVEGQLDTFLKEKLPECFNEFRQFRDQQFSIVPQGELKPETRITRGNVIILLDYPLEVSRAGERFELKAYAAELPVNFYEIFTVATNITNLQAEHSFLERATRALIDVFGRADSEALPPVSEMEFGFGVGTFWTKFSVEEKIMQLLTSYIPLLRVPYTRNYRYFPAPAGANKEFYEVLYNRGFVVPVLEPHRSLNVKFSYLPWWKPYFEMNCNGQLCQPEGFSSSLGFLFGVRRYLFSYDISYPVLVEINNPDAFGGEGYSFRFMLEANMRNNVPLSTTEPPLSVPSVTQRNSMLCDESQRTGGNLTLAVRTTSGTPVDGAEILYRCGTESCSIGTSAAGALFAPLPRCAGGVLTASHRDYAPAALPLDVLNAGPLSATLVLGVPYEVDFSVKKWLLKKQQVTREDGTTSYTQNWALDTTAVVNQGPRENTIIMLNRQSNPLEEPIVIIADVCGAPVSKMQVPCGNPPEDNSKDIRIYAGDYHVTIYSFAYPSPELVIPPDRRCVSRGPFKKKKCFWVPPKPIVFNQDKPLMSGYAEYDWTVTDAELAAAKNIEFTYINFALDKVQPASARKVEDLSVMGSLFSYSEQYIDVLKPRIS